MSDKINIKWDTSEQLALDELIPFQGNLKQRSQADIDKLKESLQREGLIMPFAVWKNEGKYYILDGHGRHEALRQLAMTIDSGVQLTDKYPCLIIHADTEDDARKALLQITSQYGKITKAGVKQFTASIPTYVAPSIEKYVVPRIKQDSVTRVKQPASGMRVIKIQVAAADYESVMQILNASPYVKVL